MKYLVDTCVLSELVKPRPSEAVVAWVRSRDEADLFLSVLTLGELRKGIDRLDDGVRRRQLERWLETDLLDRFTGRVLAVDGAVALEWGRILAAAEKEGAPVPVVDSLLAATAIVHRLVVATRNVAHLERCHAEVEDPWA